MIELDFKLKSKQARNRFQRLAKKLGDLRPVWNKFISEYKEIVSANFGAKGKIMEGKRWVQYSQSKHRAMTERELKRVSQQIPFGGSVTSGSVAFSPYLKMKKKKYSNKPMLVATGKLKEKAVDFGHKAKKHSLIMRVKGKKYFYFVQHREKWGRFYFHTPDGDMPMRGWRTLIDIVNRELEK